MAIGYFISLSMFPFCKIASENIIKQTKLKAFHNTYFEIDLMKNKQNQSLDCIYKLKKNQLADW